MSEVEWMRHLDEASKKTIRWYPQWNEREDTIIKCGGFLNVPLMGTQGAINYNSELVPRQAGYPMALPPFEEATTPFVMHDLGMQNGEFLKKIRQAWRSIVRKGPESRLEQVSLTFGVPWLNANKVSDPSHMRLYRSSKRKPEGSPEHPGGEDSNKRACLEKESWSRAITQERYFKEIE
ncbi:hypothetical protein CR513_36198, partial [Mucuna pruriens]